VQLYPTATHAVAFNRVEINNRAKTHIALREVYATSGCSSSGASSESFLHLEHLAGWMGCIYSHHLVTAELESSFKKPNSAITQPLNATARL
jgi:hypothetical protein